MRPHGAFVLGACVLLLFASSASAQTYGGRVAPRRGSVEISGAGLWAQGFELDPTTAQLSRATGGQRFDLFSTESELRRFTGGQARVGVYLTRAISVEGGVRYARPEMAVRMFGDAESAPDTVATQRLQHYIFDGSVLFHFRRAAFARGNGLPFLSVGGGHVRELHEGSELVETGGAFHMTAGVKYWLTSGRRRFGLRGEAGILSREGGADGSNGRRTVPTLTGGVSYLF